MLLGLRLQIPNQTLDLQFVLVNLLLQALLLLQNVFDFLAVPKHKGLLFI
jgi:hypothetical protein